MSWIALHPDMPPTDGVDLILSARYGAVIDVTADTLDELQTIQSWADAANRPVRFEIARNGSQHRVVVAGVPGGGLAE